MRTVPEVGRTLAHMERSVLPSTPGVNAPNVNKRGGVKARAVMRDAGHPAVIGAPRVQASVAPTGPKTAQRSGVPLSKPDRSHSVRDTDKREKVDDYPNCKKRPDDNKRRGGSGGSKRFIPWC